MIHPTMPSNGVPVQNWCADALNSATEPPQWMVAISQHMRCGSMQYIAPPCELAEAVMANQSAICSPASPTPSVTLLFLSALQ